MYGVPRIGKHISRYPPKAAGPVVVLVGDPARVNGPVPGRELRWRHRRVPAHLRPTASHGRRHRRAPHTSRAGTFVVGERAPVDEAGTRSESVLSSGTNPREAHSGGDPRDRRWDGRAVDGDAPREGRPPGDRARTGSGASRRRDPEEAWDDWERRGVNQFRMLHFFLPRFREVLERELPEVITRRSMPPARCGYNPIVDDARRASPAACGDGDERFESITGRRPVMRGRGRPRSRPRRRASRCRRGVAVARPAHGRRRTAACRTSIGVVTDAGERAPRRPRGRRRRPPLGAPPLARRRSARARRSRSSRTAASSTTAATSAPTTARCRPRSAPSAPALRLGVDPHAARRQRHLGRRHHRQRARRQRCARVARRRRVGAGRVAATRSSRTGSTASRSTTTSRSWRRSRTGTARSSSMASPSSPVSSRSATRGRAPTRRSDAGATIGLLHAVRAARPCSRTHALDDHVGVRPRRGTTTIQDTVEPLVPGHARRSTATGSPRSTRRSPASAYETDDPGWLLGEALAASTAKSPDSLRDFLDIVGLNARGVDVLARPGVAKRAIELGTDPEPPPGPSRARAAHGHRRVAACASGPAR